MRALENKIIFLVGPTGSGKTEVGLKLANYIPLEFISADSMQIYLGMDIITDKLPKSLRRKYPHYLVDVVPPSKKYNAADFVKSARIAIAKILKKKKTPIVIGGTGLYVNSLVYGIFQGPSQDERIRKRLESEIEALGLAAVYERLKKCDAEAASKINPNDKKRIIRALEVYELARVPISALQKNRSGIIDNYPVYIFGLRRDRQDLYNRIEQRVDFMINAGLLDEVRKLLKKKLNQTAYMCIGIREIEGFLKGKYDFSAAISLIKRNSRRYSKRQMTWFNKNKDIEWIDVGPDEDTGAVARKIYDKINSY